MNTLRPTVAFVCTIAALAVLLVVAGQKQVVPLDPHLGVVEVWQRSQAALAALTGYSATQTDTFSYANGSWATVSSRIAIDRQTGSGWLTTGGVSRVGPQPAAPTPDLPAEVVAQANEVVARTNAELGIAPGEAVATMQLYCDGPTGRAYARTNGRDWKELTDDVIQRFGFADEVKPYQPKPTPMDLALSGIDSFDGKPVYHLTWANNGGPRFEALVDGNFHILETVMSTPTYSRPSGPSGGSLRQETCYTGFNKPAIFPADLPR